MSSSDPFRHYPAKGLMKAMKETSLSGGSERPKTYLLIVNGSAKKCDYINMGDWMGFCKVFQQRGHFGGDFWTALDPDVHLRETGYDDIKFGRTTKDSATGATHDDFFESMVLYQKDEQRNNAWFDVEDPRRIKSRVMRWISEKANLAQSGDTAIIILCGHGRPSDGAMRLGDDYLEPGELVEAIGAFKDGVQVNTAANSCYSGYFKDAVEDDNAVDQQRRFIHVAAARNETAAGDVLSPSGRWRNSPFARAWVNSMIGITLDRGRTTTRSASKEKKLEIPEGGVTIRSHLDAVEKATTTRHNPIHISHTQIFFAPKSLSWDDLLSTALLRKYVDVAFDPKEKSLRRRIESHASRPVKIAATRQFQPDQQTISRGMFLCHEEHNKFDTQPVMHDTLLYGPTIKEDVCRRNLPYLLMNIYWRTRMQIAVFEVFVMLHLHGKLSAEALTLPINYNRISQNTRNVLKMLLCFSQVAVLEDPPNLGQKLDLISFSEPVQWLATMICRSCPKLTDVNEVMSLINHSKRLGRLSESAVAKVNQGRVAEVDKALKRDVGKGKNVAAGRQGQSSSPKSSATEKAKELAPFYEWNDREGVYEWNDREGEMGKQIHNVFALILPSGRGSDLRQLYHDANMRFEEIEEVFVAFFGLTKEELAVDDEVVGIGY